MTSDDLRDLFSNVFGIGLMIAAVCIPPVIGVIGLIGVDYLISADKTVNAINAQCGTSYEKLDYLTIGTDKMLQLCETRQKRVEIVQ